MSYKVSQSNNDECVSFLLKDLYRYYDEIKITHLSDYKSYIDSINLLDVNFPKDNLMLFSKNFEELSL